MAGWPPGPSSGGVWGLAVDQHGNLVISDQQDARVRLVAASTGTFYGQAMTAGHIYTVAGDGGHSYSRNRVLATRTSVDPKDVAVDAAGNLVVDSDGEIIRVVAASTGTFYGQPMTAGAHLQRRWHRRRPGSPVTVARPSTPPRS